MMMLEVLAPPVLWLLGAITNILFYIILAQAILSWLIALGIVNTYNRIVYIISDSLDRMTGPLLRPIRRFMPNFNGIDFSPVILLLLIQFLYQLIKRAALLWVMVG